VRGVALLAVTLALAACAAPPPAASLRSYRRMAMGTVATVTVDLHDAAAADAAARLAFARINEIEDALSDWRPASETRRIETRPGERIATGPWIPLALDRSAEVRDGTDGAFDPTVGPATRLWREARARGEAPDPHAVAAVADRIGLERVAWSRPDAWVRIEPGTQFDFGGIGKGLAAEAAVGALREAGVPRALVAIAGDIAAGEAPRGRDAWRVAIDDPPGGERPTIPLRNASVSTSGDAEQAIELGEIRLAHVVDPRPGPRRGEGFTRRVAVTVVGPDGAIVDALGTALALLGPTDGARILETGGWTARGYSARFVVPEGVSQTPGFPDPAR